MVLHRFDWTTIAAEAAQTSSTNFRDEAVKAVIAAAIGFLFAFLLEQLKRRREPHKRLSWDASTQTRLLDAAPNLKDKVEILYNGTAVETLCGIDFRLENTGNQVVKHEYLRFEFPPGTRVLEVALDPEPDPELGVEEARRPATPPSDPSYRIAHLEVGQSVHFRLVATGPKAAS
jgi:hypothetical protein